MSYDIGKLDKNLLVPTTIDAPDCRLYDVRKSPFAIYGLYKPQTEPIFHRMPTDVAKSVSNSVYSLQTHTAGGRIRFSTDSPYVVLKCKLPATHPMPHMPLTGSSGFDLYIDSPDGSESLFYRTFVPPKDMTDGYESKISFYDAGTHYVTVNFPLYNAVNDVYIGIKEGSTLGAGAPYRDYPPVVYYGSSITQGGCASRPGNSYQAMVGRALNLDHVNLGFSGSAKGEEEMAHYLAGLTMSAFVMDYDHNAPTAEHLRATHSKLFGAVRAAHPMLPIVLMSRPDFPARPASSAYAKNAERRRVILDTFHEACAKGDRNVYFIDGAGLFLGPNADACTVDGTHPNDLGFARIADAVTAVLHCILRDGKLQK